MLSKAETIKYIKDASSRIPIAGRYSVRCIDEFEDGDPLFLVFFKPASIAKFVCTIKVRVTEELDTQALTLAITDHVREVISKYAVGP